MKKYWYLVSSLPHLCFGEKSPMSIAMFRQACSDWLTEEELAAVDAVLEDRRPPEGPASAWWSQEVQLRDAVVRVRAKNRGQDASPFLKTYKGFSATIEKMVVDSFAHSDPMDQEMELDRSRWVLANERAVAVPFSIYTVLTFALHVRIAERWAAMDEQQGRERVEAYVLSAIEESNN